MTTLILIAENRGREPEGYPDGAAFCESYSECRLSDCTDGRKTEGLLAARARRARVGEGVGVTAPKCHALNCSPGPHTKRRVGRSSSANATFRVDFRSRNSACFASVGALKNHPILQVMAPANKTARR